MADSAHGHVTDSRRHTAKSDQRFDAHQRRHIQTTSPGCTCSKCDTNDTVTHGNDRIKVVNTDKQVKPLPVDDKNRLEPKDEMKILKHWGFLKKTLVIGQIVDPLIEKGIVTPEQWMNLKRNEKSDQDTVEDFLYFLLKCKHDAYNVFLQALKSRGYGNVANQLEGLNSENSSPSTSVSSSNSNQNRQIGRPPNTTRMLPRQNVTITLRDPSNRTSDHQNVSGPLEVKQNTKQITEQTVVGATANENSTVKQEDLIRMKDDITRELRQLRENIEKDRDDDRLELRILQRKHTELQEDLAKTVGDREHLQKELTCVTDTVNVLKAQVEEKQNEYREVKEKNKKLEEQLEKRAGHLEILIKDKEAEKEELVQELRIKDGDYKQLQSMLEKLKKEHEERHGRLKGLTKDKITLEKEVQLLNKEKKNLEVKIKSLEQHIRALKEIHTKEIGEMKQQLDKSKALLDEKDKERTELEKRLEESVRENENLKRTNLDLHNCLQKSQDETAHLQQKLHKADMSKFALPPFLAGSKSSRTGWNPKNLKRY
ncbi:hypothetical protein ACF0H5_017700 [Mactra antiquata]